LRKVKSIVAEEKSVGFFVVADWIAAWLCSFLVADAVAGWPRARLVGCFTEAFAVNQRAVWVERAWKAQ
jgi:hypothetical protein